MVLRQISPKLIPSTDGGRARSIMLIISSVNLSSTSIPQAYGTELERITLGKSSRARHDFERRQRLVQSSLALPRSIPLWAVHHVFIHSDYLPTSSISSHVSYLSSNVRGSFSRRKNFVFAVELSTPTDESIFNRSADRKLHRCLVVLRIAGDVPYYCSIIDAYLFDDRKKLRTDRGQCIMRHPLFRQRDNMAEPNLLRIDLLSREYAWWYA